MDYAWPMWKTIEIQQNLIDHFLVNAENDGHATRLDATSIAAHHIRKVGKKR